MNINLIYFILFFSIFTGQCSCASHCSTPSNQHPWNFLPTKHKFKENRVRDNKKKLQMQRDRSWRCKWPLQKAYLCFRISLSGIGTTITLEPHYSDTRFQQYMNSVSGRVMHVPPQNDFFQMIFYSSRNTNAGCMKQWAQS